MQRQITFEYNRTAQPSNATDASTLQITSIWDAMQVKVSIYRKVTLLIM